jgi:excisionase family DNA binding protein
MTTQSNSNVRTVSPAPLNSGSGRIAYKVNEAAAAIGVTPVTIYRMISRGLLRPYRGLRHPLIPASQLLELIEKGTEPAGE